jgi:hypothetical protein
MQPATLKELEWLHDCDLLSVLYDTSGEPGQSIRLRMRCPADLGYTPWDGRILVLVAIDVAAAKHRRRYPSPLLQLQFRPPPPYL